MRQLVLGRPPWQFWIEGGIGPRDASTTPIGPQRTAHLAAVEKTCTPSEIKEVNSCYSLCLKKLFVTNSEKKKNNFQIWHAHHKATGMTIFCWAKTISNNSLILTNYFEKHLKLTHWYDGPIWIKPLKEVFLGLRGPHGIPSHIITGIYASWIIWRLIKPTPPQPSTAQCSLIPVQPSTAKYSQYPNPTRNPNFLVKPDPNPTRSQKALLVKACWRCWWCRCWWWWWHHLGSAPGSL